MVPAWNALRRAKCLARCWRLDIRCARGPEIDPGGAAPCDLCGGADPGSVPGLRRAPHRLDHVHTQRAVIAAFMFLFAPLTRTAVETFACRPTCEEEDGGPALAGAMLVPGACRTVLMIDSSVECWTSDHYVIVTAAVLLHVVCESHRRCCGRCELGRDASHGSSHAHTPHASSACG